MPTKVPVKARQSTGKRVRRGGKRGDGRTWLRLVFVVLALLLVLAALWFLRPQEDRLPIENPAVAALSKLKLPDYVKRDILPADANSRRGVYLEEVGGIVIHYVANPGTSAKQNRSYFGLAETTVNSHFLVGLEGEILQCLPLEEKSAASSERNRDTISIEVCHPDEAGEFTQESYDALVKLVAWLCNNANLRPDQVIRHYDVTGKLCPIYYVENEAAWTGFLEDVSRAMEES